MKINITFFALLLSTILAINTVYSQSFPDGLVSWWRLDQNSGTTVTDKVTGASGEVVNDGTEWIEGFNGNALDFSNAVDSAVVIIEDSEDLQPINFTDQSFSVSMLVNLVAFDPTFILIKGDNGSDGPNGNGQRYAFEIKDTELRFVIDDNITKTQLGVSVPGFPLNEWAHIVGVRDRGAGSLFLYLNGTEIGNMVDATGTLDLDSMRLLLGNYHHLEGKINGAIDEVMIFDTVLTAAEVAALKDSILNYVEPDIFTYSLNTSELIVGADGSGFTSLDSTWSHDNGNDTWDGSAIGEGSPGGISTIDGYLRFQDTGNPTSHGMPDPSNRKLTMVRDIGPNGGTATMLNDGATLFFTTRLATDGLLDAIYPNTGGALTAVPSAGDGYVIHNGGVGMIGIHQSSVGLISFTLVTAEENNGTGGLMMNSLNGTTPSENVNFGEGTANVLELDPTVWHDFWITIQADASGVGTHQVDVSVDSGEVQTFIVTAGSSASFADISTLRLGVGATDQSGAFDIAAFKFAPGVKPAPVSPVDKPVINLFTDYTNDYKKKKLI